ncbi:ABC transporter permease [Bradyrhizobium sp. LTSP885]|uniref:carbohydrate ABC transporter permease n=1 Tax=Bradyrhizobium sp. LTSP885 TaxID=1619232 RepID=UPI0005CA1953|nr:sugar ABC transporter permease [Bradyrhizobium sp. LTSP885]KJC50380.1 ABC transporter permease [Bradyrhizobium sp. LTSP885]
MKPFDNRAWLFMLPAVAVLLFVGIVPLVTVFNYSFFDIFSLQQLNWVGVQWYRDILSTERFYDALARSVVFSAIVLCVQIPLGVGIALILPRGGWRQSVALMLLAAPLVVPSNMIPIMWLNLISPAGLAGRTFAWLGIAFDYKFNAIHTWLVLVIMDTWHWLGLVVVLAYSGLSGIQPAFYQAAAIDGASRFQIFRHIELPKIGGVLSMALLLRFVDSFMIYTEAFRINAGGPNGATTFLSLDLGEDIQGFNYGMAAARSMIYFLMILIVAWSFKTTMDGRKKLQTVNRA